MGQLVNVCFQTYVHFPKNEKIIDFKSGKNRHLVRRRSKILKERNMEAPCPLMMGCFVLWGPWR